MDTESSALDPHRFTLRRRGYDPGEVDAVLRRVADSLRRYEERIDELEHHAATGSSRDEIVAAATAAARQTLREAQAEAMQTATDTAEQARAVLDAARDEARAIVERARDAGGGEETEIAARVEVGSLQRHDYAMGALDAAISEAAAAGADAERAAAELLGRARDEAADLLAGSRREAEAFVSAAVREAHDMRLSVQTEVDEIRRRRQAKADELVTSAVEEADAVRAAARADAAAIVSAAEIAAGDELRRVRVDSSARLASAQAQSDSLLEEARRQAVAIVIEARREKLRLLQRIEQLRGAAREFEQELGGAAAPTPDRARFLQRMMEIQERIDTHLIEDTVDEIHPAPEPVAAGPGLTIDLTDAAVTLADLRERGDTPFAVPDGSGRPPAARGTIDPSSPSRFASPTMRRTGGAEARAGRSIAEAIAASKMG